MRLRGSYCWFEKFGDEFSLWLAVLLFAIVFTDYGGIIIAIIF
jgi:hypothetical protein